jgi:hypothetical protein
MPQLDVAAEIVADLLRSAWVIERSRTDLFERWTPADARFERLADQSRSRAVLIEGALQRRELDTDDEMVEPHAAWLRSLTGEAPDEVALGPIFATRIGDWVVAHAGPFLEAKETAALEDAADLERLLVGLPENLPGPPGYEPLEIPHVEAPGPVLFRFAILGDMHIGSPQGERRVRAAIEDINRSGAELLIQLGDITDHGHNEEFARAVEVLAGSEPPVTTMMGNHDVYSIEESRLSGREYFSGSFGREPDGVLLEHKGFRFAVLDSTEHGSSPFGPFDFMTGSFTGGDSGAVVRGSLTPPHHELLAEVAAPGGGPAFVFLHHPPQPFWGFPPILFGLREADSGRLHAVIDSGNVWGVFAGHTHRNARTRTYETVVAQEVAIPRDFPFGYALVDVAENGFAYRFVQLSNEALLREAYEGAGEIHRRYGGGPPEARAFSWERPTH